MDVLRYLAGTKTVGITYGTSPEVLTGYTDADYSTCRDTRKSRSGFVFILFGGAVSWSSKLQSVVALSTAESEYIAAAGAAREGTWLRRVAAEMDILLEGPLVLHGDNQAAHHLAKNKADKQRTKHIDVAYHFIRQQVDRQVLQFKFVSTDYNAADIFTKALPEVKVLKFSKLMGVC